MSVRGVGPGGTRRQDPAFTSPLPPCCGERGAATVKAVSGRKAGASPAILRAGPELEQLSAAAAPTSPSKVTALRLAVLRPVPVITT
jgi:hypothetical protein